MICLCCESYCCFVESADKIKLSSEGQNTRTIENSDTGQQEKNRWVLGPKMIVQSTNHFSRTLQHSVCTCEQTRPRLSYLYTKSIVLCDGMHAKPLLLLWKNFRHYRNTSNYLSWYLSLNESSWESHWHTLNHFFISSPVRKASQKPITRSNRRNWMLTENETWRRGRPSRAPGKVSHLTQTRLTRDEDTSGLSDVINHLRRTGYSIPGCVALPYTTLAFC